ncbi:MAG: M14 family metallopeptidase [Oscillospiraceae bacterium]
MTKKILYSIKSPYRESMDVTGFTFGEGEKSLCVIGSMRGNEIQQMYVCSQLIQKLKQYEAEGKIASGKEITVVPCVNYYSMNIGKRFWTMDNTDINRMFPGYDLGETTQRIAGGFFSQIQGYEYGIQLASFYQPGHFLSHVKLMETGFTDHSLMKNFGLPYAFVRRPRPYDTTTLNYNWQIWGTKSFSLYTNETDKINEASANQAVDSILRFMKSQELLVCSLPCGYKTELIDESRLIQVHSDTPGIMRNQVHTGARVKKGDLLCEITDPLEGHIIKEITSPCDAIVFFRYNRPLEFENTVLYKLIAL